MDMTHNRKETDMTARDSYFENFEQAARVNAEQQLQHSIELERKRLENVTVLPGQPNVAYHFDVVLQHRFGQNAVRRYSAFDLQDAIQICTNLQQTWLNVNTWIEDALTGKVIQRVYR